MSRQPYSYTMPERFLTAQEVPAKWRIWAILNGFFINNQKCWASNEWFGEKLGIHKDTASRAIQELEEEGLIICTRTRRSRNIEPVLQIVESEIGTNVDLRSASTPISDRHTRRSISISNSIREDLSSKKSFARVPLKKKSKFNQYSEDGDSVVDIETGEMVGEEESRPGFDKRYRDLTRWAEDRRGSKFVNIPKQYAAMKKMRNAGIGPGEIKERWEELEEDAYFQEHGFDFMNVAASFDKRR